MKKTKGNILLVMFLFINVIISSTIVAHAEEGVYTIPGVEYDEDGTISGNDNSLGTGSFGVTGIIQEVTSYEITTLDVTIPIDGIIFNIDKDGVLYTQGMVIQSNTSKPLNVDVIKVESVAIGDNTGDIMETTIVSPTLVPANTYTTNEWNNLSAEDTMKYIALSLKQVDVVNDEASDSLTDLTVDTNKVTTPVQLGNLGNNYRLAHIESGFNSTASVGINIEKDSAYTNYGKNWIGESSFVFRYKVTLEFSY